MQILFPVLISISHENTIETSLKSTKYRIAKLFKIEAWSQGLLFTRETSFFSWFFFNIPEISPQTQKLTKYESTKTQIGNFLYLVPFFSIPSCISKNDFPENVFQQWLRLSI